MEGQKRRGRLDYDNFISKKSITSVDTGLDVVPEIRECLKPFQRDIVRWALRRGRAAIFADCGLGKTLMQLEWAYHVPGNVLIVAPLAVSTQTLREAAKFGIDGVSVSQLGDVSSKITITNYERIENFNPDDFNGVVLDESSILKSYTGKFRNKIIDEWSSVPFRLACTATPAPNDFMELGNHAEFMGAMSRTEMLSMFFVHDGGETQKWRIKGHATSEFWRWICSWAVMIRKPSDIGHDDDGYILPEMDIHQHVVKSSRPQDGMLFSVEAKTMIERRQARRASIEERVALCADLVNSTDGAWVVWCDMNAESVALSKAITGAVEVTGSDHHDVKESAMMGFSAGEHRVIVTKPQIAGFGMNWQHCSNIAFVGLSDSYEQFYQAIRRCWRFGQDRKVQCHVITSEAEGAVVANIKRKELDAAEMAKEMVSNMSDISSKEIKGISSQKAEYKTGSRSGDGWEMHLGDCVDVSRTIPSGSIDFSVFSPPFASLYTYSNSDRDMGNCKGRAEFAEHFQYLVKDLFRITKTGRLVSFHCMNLPTSKTHDGYIGISDFRGELIRAFEAEGFIYHSEVCIWKDPVTAMQRTKALGLLHKQVVKDSAMSRQGIPDYLVTMRKPGDNPNPVAGEFDHFCGDMSTFRNDGRLSIDIWQRYASPVWMDINPSNTLQYRSARDHNDERHICPLQLDVIHRALQMWSNKGDIVFSPFAGIGSEGYESVKLGRRFIGVELKESYYKQACLNMVAAEHERDKGTLFEALA